MTEYLGNMYIFGGFDENFTGFSNIYYNKLYSFDTFSNVWSLLDSGSGPSPRAFPAAITDPLHAQMLVFGGITYNAFFGDIVLFNDLWSWNYFSRRWTLLTNNTGPSPRTYASGAYLNGNMYILGGVIDPYFDVGNDLWSFNTFTNTWTQLIANGNINSPPARGTYQLQPSILDNKLYLNGGEGAAAAGFPTLNDTWMYDPFLNSWTDITPPASENLNPGHDNYQGSTLVANKMVIYGGETPGSSAGCDAPFAQNPTNETWSFDIFTHRWTQLFPTQTLINLKRHTADHFGLCMYVVGGWSWNCPPGQIWNNNVYSYKIDLF
jgi:N-acetylneuraminic acid mutarotase